MPSSFTLILLALAVLFTGLLAGISLDKAMVQLPARGRLGVQAFSAFSRANDLGNGLAFYPIMGVGSALLTVLAGLSAWLGKIGLAQAWPLYVAVFLAVLHSLATARAAPNMLALRDTTLDETALRRRLDDFAAWHALRAALQLLNFIFLLWALLVLI